MRKTHHHPSKTHPRHRGGRSKVALFAAAGMLLTGATALSADSGEREYRSRHDGRRGAEARKHQSRGEHKYDRGRSHRSDRRGYDGRHERRHRGGKYDHRRHDRHRHDGYRGDKYKYRGRDHHGYHRDKHYKYDKYRHQRHRHYDRGYYHRRHYDYHHRPYYRSHRHRHFSIPKLILGSLIHAYADYYYDKVYYEPHGHHHVIYRFPYEDTYRPYAYCEGSYFAVGTFTPYGPRF